MGMMLFGFSVKEVLADQASSVMVNFLLKKGIIQPEDAVELLAELEELETETSSPSLVESKLSKIPEKGILPTAKLGKKIQVSGRIQADGYFGDKVLRDDNTFDIRRARLAVSGEIVDDLKYKLQIDAVSSDILKDAKITYARFDEAQLSVGQFKVPFGQEELTSSTKIHTLERSEVTNAIAPGRDVGGMVHGKLFDGVLNYSGGVFNGAGANERNDNEQFLYVGRVVLTPFKSVIADKKAKLQIGGSIGYSEDDDADLGDLGFDDFVGEREIYGLDGKFTWGPLTLRGEYLRADLEYDGVPATATTKADPARDVDADGYYLIGSYFFCPKWEVVTKWEEFDGDGIKSFDALTLGLNYYFKEWTNKKLMPTRLMLNYVHGDLEGSSEEDQVLLRLQVGF